ncbi:flagellar hook capping FlgD N-terminal domain-containing protein [Roseicitreum antarcticum]|uniref:Basal-body rod modification protein FlgD n=1 Tax=Roseicitreum antarcticum TaxID=564137 RepID=A0A1H2XAJ0_9RHOB|nr:flagellar hook capping FlgD N-terminal domain-containing protein [Roseicitreum antarcticum]SDW89825.1 flagellar basal-body rod modification protein FlgD [Roseicitreum antarcticum]
MTEISTTIPSTTQGSRLGPTGSAPGTENASRRVNADFQTFLVMLTTQLQNQDPMNPMESSDFAVQLATFSGVEQQVLTNELLGSLSTRMGLTELSGWVGMEALTSAATYFDGTTPKRLIPPQVQGADQAVLTVHNAFGNEVARVPIQPNQSEYAFNGIGADGAPLPEGNYSFRVVSMREGAVLQTDPALTYGRIEEARSDGGRVMLVFAGGALVDSDSVSGLRAPST